MVFQQPSKYFRDEDTVPIDRMVDLLTRKMRDRNSGPFRITLKLRIGHSESPSSMLLAFNLFSSQK